MGVCGGAKILDSILLQPARSVCVSLGAFLNYYYYWTYVLCRPITGAIRLPTRLARMQLYDNRPFSRYVEGAG